MNYNGLTSGMRCSHEPVDTPPKESTGYYPGKILDLFQFLKFVLDIFYLSIETSKNLKFYIYCKFSFISIMIYNDLQKVP